MRDAVSWRAGEAGLARDSLDGQSLKRERTFAKMSKTVFYEFA